jgi:transposase
MKLKTLHKKNQLSFANSNVEKYTWHFTHPLWWLQHKGNFHFYRILYTVRQKLSTTWLVSIISFLIMNLFQIGFAVFVTCTHILTYHRYACQQLATFLVWLIFAAPYQTNRKWNLKLYTKKISFRSQTQMLKSTWRKLTIPERWQAVGMHNGGFSHRRVADHFRFNHSIIVRLMQRFSQTGNATDRVTSQIVQGDDVMSTVDVLWVVALAFLDGGGHLMTVRVLMWPPNAKLPRSAPAVLNGRCRRVADHFRFNHSIIVRLMQRFSQTGNATDRPRAGRPRKTTPREDRLISRRARQRPFSKCFVGAKPLHDRR